MIDILFLVIIASLFFFDLYKFQKDVNIKLHRIFIPVGVLGTLSYIYFSEFSTISDFLNILKSSLMPTLVSMFAFTIIVFIKLAITKQEVEKDTFEEEEESLKNEIIEKEFDIENLFKRFTTLYNEQNLQNEVFINDIKKEIESIKAEKSNSFYNIEELKESINYLINLFDKDTKIFQEEARSINKNSIQQLEKVIKILNKQTIIFTEKIVDFEKKLTIIENKKFIIDSNIIKEFTKNVELSFNSIKIEANSLNRKFDELYKKEKNFEQTTESLEKKFKILNDNLKIIETTFENNRKYINSLLSIDNSFKYILGGFDEIKNDFTLSLHKININSENVENSKKEIFEKFEFLLKEFETIISYLKLNNIDKKDEPTKISQNQKAINSYNSNINI